MHAIIRLTRPGKYPKGACPVTNQLTHDAIVRLFLTKKFFATNEHFLTKPVIYLLYIYGAYNNFADTHTHNHTHIHQKQQR